jgi:hypothetical protein
MVLAWGADGRVATEWCSLAYASQYKERHPKDLSFHNRRIVYGLNRVANIFLHYEEAHICLNASVCSWMLAVPL